jgi:hypothetical protein
MATIQPSAEQRKLMIAFGQTQGDVLTEVRDASIACDTLLDRLKEIICHKNLSMDNEISSIQTIMSSRQTAKFILWIDQNPACMQMLEQLWPHLTIPSSSRLSSLEDSAASEGAFNSIGSSSTRQYSNSSVVSCAAAEDDEESEDNSTSSTDESL